MRVFRTQTYDHLGQVMHWTSYHRWVEDGVPKSRTGHVAVRFTFPAELESLLRHNGFEVIRRYGDWDLTPLDADSRSIIVVCRRAR